MAKILSPRKENRKITLKGVALFSIVFYIFCLVVYESMDSSLSSLASYAIYTCLILCGLYTLSQWNKPWHWMIFSLVVFGIVLAISTLYTKASNATVSAYMYRYVTTVILLAVIAGTVSTPKDVRLLTDAFIIAGAVLAIYLYTFYGWEYLITAEERLDKAFGNQNSTAVRLVFSIILSAYNVFMREGKRRFFWLIPIALCLPAMLFLASRKGILMILAGLFALFFTAKKKVTQKIGWAIGALLLFWLLITTVPAFSVINARIDNLFSFFSGDTAESLAGDINRQKYLEMGMSAFRDRPIFGNGFYYSDYLLGVYSHNNYVELLMNNGIVGFLIYYFNYAKIFVDGRRTKSVCRPAYVFAMVILASFLALDVGVVSYFNRYTLLLLLLCSASLDAHKPPFAPKSSTRD